MQPSSNSPLINPPVTTDAALSRRCRFRGNVHFDLCNLLESMRRRERLNTVALSDASGLLIAGAGGYCDCQELSAQAASDGTAAEIIALGQRLLLSVAQQNAKPSVPTNDAQAEIGAACQRILSQGPKKPRDGLLGAPSPG